MSWFLGWFNFLPLNLPQWVYIQYLTLYGYWINWWKGKEKISNLNTDSLPSIPKTNFNSSIERSDPQGDSPSHNILNKRNLIIGLTVIALIGIWYFYIILTHITK